MSGCELVNHVAKALAAGKGGPKEGEAEAEAASEESSSPFPAQCNGCPRFPRSIVEPPAFTKSNHAYNFEVRKTQEERKKEAQEEAERLPSQVFPHQPNFGRFHASHQEKE